MRFGGRQTAQSSARSPLLIRRQPCPLLQALTQVLNVGIPNPYAFQAHEPVLSVELNEHHVLNVDWSTGMAHPASQTTSKKRPAIQHRDSVGCLWDHRWLRERHDVGPLRPCCVSVVRSRTGATSCKFGLGQETLHHRAFSSTTTSRSAQADSDVASRRPLQRTQRAVARVACRHGWARVPGNPLRPVVPPRTLVARCPGLQVLQQMQATPQQVLAFAL